jgi:sulfide:quinone oxidoreductase
MTLPVRWLTEKLAISGQISPTDLPELAAMGFQSVICNRPDHEYGPGQPTAEEIKAAAEAAGLSFAFHPVAGNGGTAADALEMGRLMATLPQPILSFCYSGGRCMALISLAARMGQPIPQ